MKQKLQSQWKRICACAAAFCTAVSMMPGIPAAAQESESAMGRYVEKELSLPEDFYIEDVVRTGGGSLRIIGQGLESGYTIWDSSDGGETWEQTGALPEEYAEEYFIDIALNPNGGGAGLVMSSQAGDGTADGTYAAADDTEDSADGVEAAGDMLSSYVYYFVSFDAQGNAQKTEAEDAMGEIQFSQSGDLLYYGYGGGVCVLDQETGETVRTLTGGQAEAIGICGNEALLLMESELQRYDYTTGEPLARDEALDEALYAAGASYMLTSSMGGPIVMAEDEEGRLYYSTANGIFSHIMGGSVVEQLVDGDLCSLASPNSYLVNMAVLDQCFYVAVFDGAQGDLKLLKYEYDPDVSSTPEHELIIYSLQENAAIRQMAVLFQQKYPDVYVNYKVGMSGTDAVTASDALRTLNTDILAGNGPDILILDEMPVETYAEQGLLMDLSDLAAEIQESEGLLENIAYAYQTDGLLPAIPAGFGFLVAAGDPELIASINGMDSLAELASQSDVLDPYLVFYIGNALYKSCSGSWKNEDNTINEEELTEFVAGVKNIYDNYMENASEKAQQALEYYADGTYSAWGEMEGAGIAGDDIALSMWNLADGRAKVVWGLLSDLNNYAGMVTLNSTGTACEQTLFSVGQSGVYVPSCVLGVLNTANDKETACNFVRYMLSAEGQEQNSGGGFPVNVTAFENEVYSDQAGESMGYSVSLSNSDDGTYYELVFRYPTREEADALYEMVNRLSICADTEQVQYEVISQEVERCLSGEADVEEAVNSIMQKINLYLAE